jgi:H+/Cl- antiporter ClcA
MNTHLNMRFVDWDGLMAGWMALPGLFGIAVAALSFVVAVVLAVLVYRDAANRRRDVLGIAPLLWFLVVLFTSFLGVVGYWLMTHSTLAMTEKKAEPEQSNS